MSDGADGGPPDTDGSDGSERSDGSDSSGGSEDPAAITPERDRLLLDVMLGKLASYLRMCGYDALYALDEGIEDDDALRRLAASEARRLVTRDRDLAASTPGALLLTEREVVDQLRELRAAGVRLRLDERPSRCGACNAPVERVADGEKRPEYTPDEGPLWRCVDCGQHFWRGSHRDDVADTLASL